ncbi:MAG: hypothetical protein U0934_21320 [Pseudotabrizicola sp.]|uniref:hypothetical protein n=1 Tax=Pseudotabrizicola sp. TaxID=2939647 RepID=UPI002727A8E7|nr:hypothetical protein [Pseudotabrizicola sp.]MDO8883503.1 hypothetical protein [Pseudotabrizicola sp.]MDP2082068.1 hypothetical protein [Pseudotabrizicola sp.]MDZ7576461.1 hypothetical protein [Pseudotabrizicola sp.]
MITARILLCLATLLPLPAAAQDLASADAIRASIVGNTVRGSMVASGGFTEYYAPDGAIRGPDYSGEWSIRDNRMCFGYDGNPASCWAVRVNGRNVVWVGTAGDEGTGTILPGNPNKF